MNKKEGKKNLKMISIRTRLKMSEKSRKRETFKDLQKSLVLQDLGSSI